MSIQNIITYVDTHATGCPIRIVTGGFPMLKADTMLGKMTEMKEKYDWVRTATMCEPRGHRNMVGAVLTEPCDKEADVGIFYIDSGGYAPMCGAGSIALGKALIEMGYVKMQQPVTEVKMDTPSGLVKAYVTVENGVIQNSTFENIPSFVYKTNLSVNIPEYGNIPFDITYGGNFFVMLPISAIGIPIIPENGEKLADLGMEILKKVNSEMSISHPDYPDITFLNDLMFLDGPYMEEGRKIYKNLVIFGGKQVDRSPCGTGSCARMALLMHKGELNIGEEFIHRSIIDTEFIGKPIRAQEKNGFNYVTCQLTGDTHTIGMGSFILEENDPMKNGFWI